MTQFIMVLNDGETYTNLEGCAIVAVPDDVETEDVERQLDEDDGTDFVVVFGVGADGPFARRPNDTEIDLA